MVLVGWPEKVVPLILSEYNLTLLPVMLMREVAAKEVTATAYFTA